MLSDNEYRAKVRNLHMIPENKEKVHLWGCDPFCPVDFRFQDARNLAEGRPRRWADKGKTDDTMALQRAIEAVDELFVPEGAYLISGSLRLRPLTRLFGEGRSILLVNPAVCQADAVITEKPHGWTAGLRNNDRDFARYTVWVADNKEACPEGGGPP